MTAPILSYIPPLFPAAGRFVMFHHGEDVWDWPALILQVQVRDGSNELIGSIVSSKLVKSVTAPHDTPDFDPLTDDLPIGWFYECHLQVFRPRGNDWRWSVEGLGTGQWSWPGTAPTPSPALIGIERDVETTLISETTTTKES